MLYDVSQFSDVVPLDYMLYQNYPNPINPGTEIRFDIPEYSSIEIDAGVTDQKVFVVLENKYAPNTYGAWSFQVYFVSIL